jgi:hydroxymethylglutaryl-CoA reductase
MDASKSRLPGFYKRPLDDRLTVVANLADLDAADVRAFTPEGGLACEIADHMVENAIGVLALPLGVATNFVIDGEGVLVPMAVEEPSVVAACSHIAGLAAKGGGFRLDVDPPIMIGQIQVVDVTDVARATTRIEAASDALMAEADLLCPGLVERGGGCRGIEVRVLPPLEAGPHVDLDDDQTMLVVHVMLDCRDAMGANAINTVVEGLASRIERLAEGRVCLRILSNLADRRLARATMEIPFLALAGKDAVDDASGERVARAIVDAYRFAARDPYRACTHNKGIMNGIDAVAIATGNDWRAIEAGAHAFAARDGRYTSLTSYRVDTKRRVLVGHIELPMAVGTVGGSTRVHPTVKSARKLLGRFADRAERLAGVLAAVGLAQNCGALKALATEGIQRGHMSLHARQVALAVGATGDEVDRVAAILVGENCFRPVRAEEVLIALRPTTVGREGRPTGEAEVAT